MHSARHCRIFSNTAPIYFGPDGWHGKSKFNPPERARLRKLHHSIQQELRVTKYPSNGGWISLYSPKRKSLRLMGESVVYMWWISQNFFTFSYKHPHNGRFTKAVSLRYLVMIVNAILCLNATLLVQKCVRLGTRSLDSGAPSHWKCNLWKWLPRWNYWETPGLSRNGSNEMFWKLFPCWNVCTMISLRPWPLRLQVIRVERVKMQITLKMLRRWNLGKSNFLKMHGLCGYG